MELNGAAIVRLPATLSPASVGDLRTALENAATAYDCRVVVLTGADETTFCDGMDIASALHSEALERALDDFAACLETLRVGPVITLSVVQGRASGGGVGLAAACDGVLASADATFGLPELLFGMTPAIIAPYLLERMRPQKVRWLALSAERFDADAARRAGLVDHVCAPGSETGVLRSWVRQVRRLDPGAALLWKRASPGWRSISRDCVHQTLTRLRDPGVVDRIRAFVERGQSPWMNDER